MNKTNLLDKLVPLGITAFSAISVIGIATAPAQAGTLAWENGTSSFASQFDPIEPGEPVVPAAPSGDTNILNGNVIVPSSFQVQFSPDEIALISGADGEFLPDFLQAPPPYQLDTLTSNEATFNFLQWEAPVGNEPYNEFEYVLDGDLVFNYGAEGNNATVTIESGAIFLGEIDLNTQGDPVGVEFEALVSDFIVNTGGNTYTIGNGTPCVTTDADCQVIGEVFEFAEAFNSTVGGVYDGEVVVAQVPVGVPEPATILGLLTISSLALGLKCKK